jgi:hypothetical protein
MDWAKVIVDLGLPVGLVLFFVWHDKKEKQRLAERLTAVEELARNQMQTVVQENTEAFRTQSALLKRIVEEGCGRRVAEAAGRVS